MVSIKFENHPIQLRVSLVRKCYKICIKKSVISMEAGYGKIYIR